MSRPEPSQPDGPVAGRDHDNAAALAELAEAHGVATSWQDQSGARHEVGEATLRAVLACLGVGAADPEQVAQSLAGRRLGPWRRTLPAVLVVRHGDPGQLSVHVPAGAAPRVSVELEDGGSAELARVEGPAEQLLVDRMLVERVRFVVPEQLAPGWHKVHATGTGGPDASCPLVVTPRRLTTAERIAPGGGWGFAVQLYAVRSGRSWGLGDLADLADLARWSGGELGADFVLVNPLDAPAPGPPREPSPYLPATRRFADPAYLRVEDIAEYADLPAADRRAIEQLAGPVRAGERTADLLDRDRAWTAKAAALALVHAVPLSAPRAADLADYVAGAGQGLADFALWCALAEHYGPMPLWPTRLLDPRGPAVAEQRTMLADRIGFHQWCQWVLDGQLADAQRAALAAGMCLGVVHDLPVGVHRYGSDSWALHDVLAPGVTVGAPPDMYNQQGQDWSQPPWHPDRLAAAGYLPYRDLVRTVLRHAGGLRVDHVLGLFRLWWVPEGMTPGQGTYVRYDHEALLGILVLEAQGAGAVVIGEDLGTVEPWMQDTLADWGVLGTSVLWFERDSSGRPRAPQRWRREALAAVSTHDLPPTAGYLSGEHVRLRASLGLLARPEQVERRAHREELDLWLAELRRQGLLSADPGEQEIVEALHRYVLLTPSRLVAVSLPDAVGGRLAQNQPGTSREYPNWSLPLTDASGAPVLLEDLAASPRAASLARLVGALRPGGSIRA